MNDRLWILRFAAGFLVGLLIAGIFWTTSSYFGYSISWISGSIGCSILAIASGLMTVKWGYKTLENLLETLR